MPNSDLREDPWGAFPNPKTGYIDLTSEVILEASRTLEGKKALQLLGQELNTLKPRRARGIESSSAARAIRVKLLPDNMYFLDRVRALRAVLCIPPGYVSAEDYGDEDPSVGLPASAAVQEELIQYRQAVRPKINEAALNRG